MARPKSDVIERFFAKVKRVETGCLEWQSTIKKDGYGSFHFDGKSVQAHRVAYELFFGKIPAGVKVLHKCDNRKCVNVNHLFFGSLADNVVDMDAKGRRGSKSKLTYDQVEQIKGMLVDRYSQTEIGKIFGVCQTVISRIKLGKTRIFKLNS